jgi:SET domain-containing protein
MSARISPSRHLRIARSSAGLGLFARVPIRKGQFIVRYSGRKICTDDADDLNTRYLFEINSRWTIDGASRRNVARYINHSCRPNAEVYFVRHAIKIRAIKNIKAGDEITYHYGRNYFTAFIKPVGCKCWPCARKRASQRAEMRANGKAADKRNGAKARHHGANGEQQMARRRVS